MATQFRACSIPGCKDNAHKTANGYRGWCSKHYQRWRRHKDPLGGGTAVGEPMAWLLRNAAHDSVECLHWPYGKYTEGYGMILHNGSPKKASRVMCIIVHGDPPTPEHEAAHNCGKGHEGCVNPRHLRWSTHKENETDKHQHGTSSRGSNNYGARLTEEQVRTIRRLSASHRQKSIAEMFGITQQTVSDITLRRRWAWLK